MAVEIIEHNINGNGNLRAFLITGSVDRIVLDFYKSIYPEISHFDPVGVLLDTVNEIIFESEQDTLLFVDKIEIDEDSRGMGLGTEAMKELIETSSTDFIMLIASPIGDSQQNIEDVVDFYSKFNLYKVKEVDREAGYLMSTITLD